MKHKINFILFSNLFLLSLFELFSKQKTAFENIFISFHEKKLVEVLVVQEKVLTLHSQFGNEL